MANNNQQVDPQLVQILDVLSKFGFKFFGYNEAKEPLVIAQNGQVVTVSIAYNFVQTQMAKASASASLNGVESMPQAPVLNQMPTAPESKIETKIEQGIEKKDQQNFSLENIPKVENKAPQTNSNNQTQGQSASPFGDGFQVSSFDPSKIDQTIEFVKKSSNLKQTSPRKYLALQFEKFLSEIKLANRK